MASATTSRTFPLAYVSQGDKDLDRLAFFHILERLKTQKRTGWVNNSVSNAESISDHMYRMAMLAMCSEDTSLDISKCVMLCLVHDLAEAQVGDITPEEGFTKEEKYRLEAGAMENLCRTMLHDSAPAQRIYALWKEYEERLSPEAKFVKDLDRFEMACQADEYETAHHKNLQTFFDHSLPLIVHPEVKSWGETIQRQRGKRQA
ncbi:HD domain-containing protein [Sistotremastrum niveocremeum HHB9708]|uniref:5'-deoxynucleotidase n=1 Tax=Sistotremastrum niveocremeum HHB9708 TaxID=1314777 RepID=A0A164VR38_9AGAM|nr:HD domain-containing protein [Sistotremastrum niveocremeum HHB9708]